MVFNQIRIGEVVVPVTQDLDAAGEYQAVEQTAKIPKVEDLQSPVKSGRVTKAAEPKALPEATSFVEDLRSQINIAEAKLVDQVAGKSKMPKKVKDFLAIPEEGVTVQTGDRPLGPKFLSTFQSTGFFAKNTPELLPFFKRAKDAVRLSDKGRGAFGNRLKKMEDILDGGNGQTPLVGRIKRKLTGKSQYKENNAHLQEIAVQGDLLRKEFTPAELRSNFGANEAVVKGYGELRKFYKVGLDVMNRARHDAGKPKIEPIEGYVPHYFQEFRIIDPAAKIAQDAIISTARTLSEAVKKANEITRKDGRKLVIRPKRFTESIGDGEAFNAAVLGDKDFFRIRNKLEKEFQLNPQDAGSMLEQFSESFRLKKRTRTFANQMHRRGFKGYEQDLNYINRHYANSLSRFIALDKFKRKSISDFERRYGAFDKEYTGTPKAIKEYINDVNGNPSGVEAIMNDWVFRNPMMEKMLVKNFGDRPFLGIANGVTNFTAIAKLGLFNVASAAVNGMQMINANAVLGPKFTSIGMKNAAQIAGSNFLKKGFGKKLRNRAIIEDMQLLRELGVEIQQGLEHGAGFSKFNQMGKLFRSSTALFSGIEWQLRAGTVLGQRGTG